ncbi:MAG: carboxypeptidase regulatory-like domain-containing protein [Armatimonadetes bacterium]|nr:carboxypeptidase regulatory-like domain-containing protein [Armatimonadota bacterium]
MSYNAAIAIIGVIIAVALVGCGGGISPGGEQVGVLVLGRVVDADTNEGVNDAVVIINGYRMETVNRNEGGAGWFELTVVIPTGVKEIPVTVSKHGYQTYAMTWRPPQPMGTTYQFEDIELSRRHGSATIGGKVIDGETGKGIVNAMITVISGGLSTYGWTDINGEFLLSGIPAGSAKAEVRHPNFLVGYVEVVVLVDEQRDIGEIKLLRLGYPISVIGIVLNAEDQSPIEGATVTIAQGRFELSGVPSGEQQVRISHPDYEPYEAKIVIRGGELTFYLAPKGTLPSLPYNIGGLVRIADGQLAKGAAVELIDAKSSSIVARTFTNSNGRYSFFVPAGEYIVRAQLSGYKPQERRITLLYGAILSDVNFELEPL